LNEATRASKQDRSAPRETQPFIFQGPIARAGGLALCNKHDPKTLPQIMLVPADNLTQTAPHTIANYRASEATRGDEADTTRARILDHRRAER